MKKAVNTVFEFCLHIFGFTHSKYPTNFYGKLSSFLVLIFHLVFLSNSVRIAYGKISEEALHEMWASYVQICILCVSILSSYLVFIFAWIGGKLERKISENLKNIDEIFSEGWIKATKATIIKKVFKIISKVIFQFIPFTVCILLSFVEVLLNKKTGIWRILIYPILLTKCYMYFYAMHVDRITKRVEKINSELEELIQEDDKINLSIKKLSTVVENQKLMMKISKKTEKFTKTYEILFDSVKIFNKRFGLLILLSIMSNFLSMVFCGYKFIIEVETTRGMMAIIGK
jgi:hypothetical protein